MKDNSAAQLVERLRRTERDSLASLVLAGTASLTSFDGHCVRIDFSTRDDAEAMFEALTRVLREGK